MTSQSPSAHAANDAAWAAFTAGHTVGDIVTGDIVSVVPFGAFVRVQGVDGFTPRTAWTSLPDVGDRVSARIVAVDTDTRRFAVEPA